jgi:hypothetical protein
VIRENTTQIETTTQYDGSLNDHENDSDDSLSKKDFYSKSSNALPLHESSTEYCPTDISTLDSRMFGDYLYEESTAEISTPATDFTTVELSLHTEPLFDRSITEASAFVSLDTNITTVESRMLGDYLYEESTAEISTPATDFTTVEFSPHTEPLFDRSITEASTFVSLDTNVTTVESRILGDYLYEKSLAEISTLATDSTIIEFSPYTETLSDKSITDSTTETSSFAIDSTTSDISPHTEPFSDRSITEASTFVFLDTNVTTVKSRILGDYLYEESKAEISTPATDSTIIEFSPYTENISDKRFKKASTLVSSDTDLSIMYEESTTETSTFATDSTILEFSPYSEPFSDKSITEASTLVSSDTDLSTLYEESTTETSSFATDSTTSELSPHTEPFFDRSITEASTFVSLDTNVTAVKTRMLGDYLYEESKAEISTPATDSTIIEFSPYTENLSDKRFTKASTLVSSDTDLSTMYEESTTETSTFATDSTILEFSPMLEFSPYSEPLSDKSITEASTLVSSHTDLSTLYEESTTETSSFATDSTTSELSPHTEPFFDRSITEASTFVSLDTNVTVVKTRMLGDYLYEESKAEISTPATNSTIIEFSPYTETLSDSRFTKASTLVSSYTDLSTLYEESTTETSTFTTDSTTLEFKSYTEPLSDKSITKASTLVSSDTDLSTLYKESTTETSTLAADYYTDTTTREFRSYTEPLSDRSITEASTLVTSETTVNFNIFESSNVSKKPLILSEDRFAKQFKIDEIEYYYIEEEYSSSVEVKTENMTSKGVQKRDNSAEYYVESISESREYNRNFSEY